MRQLDIKPALFLSQLGLCICIMLIGNFAWAQASQNSSTTTPNNVAQGKQKNKKIRTRRSKKRGKSKASKNQKQKSNVIEFKQLSVEGTVQRPSAAYLLQRRKLKFKGLTPQKSFIPKILKSVKKYPF